MGCKSADSGVGFWLFCTPVRDEQQAITCFEYSVLVITDGQSNGCLDPVERAEWLHDDGIKVHAVSIGFESQTVNDIARFGGTGSAHVADTEADLIEILSGLFQ